MMKPKKEGYRRYVFIGIILIALGIVYNTSLGSTLGSIGTVLIAVGGLFFIVGMNKKRQAAQGK